MQAKDVMTTEVVTIGPDASVQQVAMLLSERGISGVPVVDEAKRVVGIISEGDLLHRIELGTERRPARRRQSWWLSSFAAAEAPDYVKSRGRRVNDLMTQDVVTVTEDTPLADVATLLETRGIKRVPVVRDGSLVGIISRANLVRALASAPSGIAAAAPANEEEVRNRVKDEMIRARVLKELHEMEWANVWADDVMVKDQIVHLWFCEDQPLDQRRAVHIAAENTPDVRGVKEHIVPGPPLAPPI